MNHFEIISTVAVLLLLAGAIVTLVFMAISDATRKPEPDWKAKYEEAWAIAGRLYAEMEREYSFEQEARSQAMREYEEAAKHD